MPICNGLRALVGGCLKEGCAMAERKQPALSGHGSFYLATLISERSGESQTNCDPDPDRDCVATNRNS